MNKKSNSHLPDDVRFAKEQQQIADTLNESSKYLKKMERIIADYREFNRRAKDYLRNSSMPSDDALKLNDSRKG